MRGDFSRDTFVRKRHYSGVLMQQGRVQVDADFNEQQAIDRYRTEIVAGDIIGKSGTPLNGKGFKILAKIKKSDTNNPNISLIINNGRYYVDGILCENDDDTWYDNQAQVYGISNYGKPLSLNYIFKKFIKMNPICPALVYLDVWMRGITASDDPHIREVALGGPDTSMRAQTIWQVKILPLKTSLFKDINKLVDFAKKKSDIEQDLEGRSTSPNIRKYLADLDQSIFSLYNAPLYSGYFEDWKVWIEDNWKDNVEISTGMMKARLESPPEDKEPCDPLHGAKYGRSENQLYRVEIHRGGVLPSSDPAKVPTFKWSRDNGSVITEVIEDEFDPKSTSIKVADLGRDELLGFSRGQWVEIYDDAMELNGQPGQLLMIDKDPENNKIELKSPPTDLSAWDGKDKAKIKEQRGKIKLRRWDQSGDQATGAGVTMTSERIELEDGIEVTFQAGTFQAGTYRTGDYWLIPARAPTEMTDGKIEWPPYDDFAQPEAQSPLGIKHHFAPLALILMHEDSHNYKDNIYVIADLREKFPCATENMSLFYISGDGQEAMPGNQLPQPLQVGVANGTLPVAGVTVKFELEDASSGDTIQPDKKTGLDGIARCMWKLGSSTPKRVIATLRDASNNPVGLPIFFNASLSVASDISYDPKGCKDISGVTTVQDAIDELCRARREGCAITVGKGKGRYDFLDEAIKEELKKQNDIFICMLPGDHMLKNGLNISSDKPANVKIVGCGAGTRINLNKKSWLMRNMAYVSLKDLEIQAGEMTQDALVFDSCEEVKLEGCHVSGISSSFPYRMQGKTLGPLADQVKNDAEIISALFMKGTRFSQLTVSFDSALDIKGFWQISDTPVRVPPLTSESALVSIKNVAHFKLQDSVLEANAKEGIQLNNDMFADVDIFGDLHNALDRRDYLNKAKEISKALAEEDKKIATQQPSARKIVKEKLEKLLIKNGPRLTKSEKESYQLLREELGKEGELDTAATIERLVNIWDTARRTRYGTALVLSNGKGTITLKDNHISGTVCLYGPAIGPKEFFIKELESLLPNINEDHLSIATQEGVLRMRGNKLTRMDVGWNAKKEILSVVDNPKTSLDFKDAFHQILLTENIIEQGQNLWIAGEVRFSTNRFEKSGSQGNIGVAINDNAIYVGNSSEDSNCIISNHSQEREKSANINMAIHDI